ncbi:c2h2 type zinc finger domain-containing protein [Stemphylium lycopersici]|nr:c2h2 type zinc finger domain-containing protein [Stemphylium lycopersici]
MGRPMLSHLARKLPGDSHILVYDVVEQVVDDVCAEFPEKVSKGKSAKDIAEQVDTIITMVPEGAHVRSVYLDPENGVCSTDISKKLLIDCSTIDTATSLAVKDHISENFPSAVFYDSPVSGGVVGAVKGTIAFFLGCAELDPNVERLKYLLGLMGSQVIPCGGPSLGLAAKLSNNYLSGIIAIACSEAFDMGMRSGLDPRTLAKVYAAGTAQNTICDRFCPVPHVYPEAPSSGGWKQGFKVQLMRKDFGLAVEMAKRVGSQNVLGEVGLETYDGAANDPRCRDLDSRVVYRYLGGQEDWQTKPDVSIMSTDPKYYELHTQLFEEGLKMRRSVVGDEYVNRALENGSTEFSRAGQELVTEMCWGYAWTRPGLDKKQRSLINIGMLMALNRAPELAVHVRGARNNGLSELEIREAIIHATTYCGVPAGVDAMKTAEKVLNDMAEKGEMARELGNRSDRAGMSAFYANGLCFGQSDLLVRHERLTHRKGQNGRQTRLQTPVESVHTPVEHRSHKRMRSSFDSGRPVPEIPSMMSSPALVDTQSSQCQPTMSHASMTFGQHSGYSLTALSMAAEYQALQGSMENGTAHTISTPMPSQPETIAATIEHPHAAVPTEPSTQIYESIFGESLDSLTAFLDSEPLDSYHFSSLINTEQPMPFFSPDSFGYGQQELPEPKGPMAPTPSWRQTQQDEPPSLSRFGSRFPSLQPDDPPREHATRKRPIADISHDDRQKIVEMLTQFSSVIPTDFVLPTRLALCRYIAAYINGFHEHMPFLHIPTMSVDTCSVELLLALAAVGAQYTFEGEKGVELFTVSKAIATERIRKRDTRLVKFQYRSESERPSRQNLENNCRAQSPRRRGSMSGPLGLPIDRETPTAHREDLMQTAQALLLLMALSTWAKHKEILREALAIQSILATLVRDDGLEIKPLPDKISWKEWIRRETVKRTKFIVYGFSNLHCIVYNIPPFMLTSEVKLPLPCNAAEFKAPTELLWKEARKNGAPEVLFQDALKRLFTKNGRDVTEVNSSSGNYALIHALIQHVFFLRQVSRCRFEGPGDLSAEDVTSLENALRNWQIGWRRNPESSLDPMNQNGPVAFNSTALLRLAYIRLYVDTSGRALETRDPVLIANAFRAGPAIRRSTKITRAVLHSAHALSIPIKIGYRLVAKTQSFIWSIQHSLCTLECAYLMSKWLEALSVTSPDSPVTEDEQKIIAIVKSMLDETEFALPPGLTPGSSNFMKCLSAGVLRVWATIFKGSQTWAIVDIIGSSLNLYADILESA